MNSHGWAESVAEVARPIRGHRPASLATVRSYLAHGSRESGIAVASHRRTGFLGRRTGWGRPTRIRSMVFRLPGQGRVAGGSAVAGFCLLADSPRDGDGIYRES